MGVKTLWPILEPAKESMLLSDFQHKTVAVDLGFWVCQLQTAVHNPTVSKPFLRNLFFRILHLIQRDIHIVFVTEGKASSLKTDTIRARLQSSNGKSSVSEKNSQTNAKSEKSLNRPQFQKKLNDCCELIRLLGLPIVQSDGEAEAYCAALNLAGVQSGLEFEVVDAVVSDDSDCFLYGAQCVLRNFGLEGKEPTLNRYRMDKIKETLSLDRDSLVAAALMLEGEWFWTLQGRYGVVGLKESPREGSEKWDQVPTFEVALSILGCDFSPKGIPGVGRETVCKFLSTITGTEALEKLRNPTLLAESGGDKAAQSILKRILDIPNFPDERVIDEFLKLRPPPFSQCPDWHIPDLPKFQQFMNKNVEWEDEYCVAKLVPLISLWDLRQAVKGGRPRLKATQLIKRRVKDGKPYFEVQWAKLECDKTTVEDYYVTLAPADLFRSAWTDLVSAFDSMKLTNKKKTKRTAKKPPGKPITTFFAAPSAVREHQSDSEDEDPTETLSNELENSLMLIEDEEEEKADLESSFRDFHIEIEDAGDSDSDDLLSESLQNLAVSPAANNLDSKQRTAKANRKKSGEDKENREVFVPPGTPSSLSLSDKFRLLGVDLSALK